MVRELRVHVTVSSYPMLQNCRPTLQYDHILLRYMTLFWSKTC